MKWLECNGLILDCEQILYSTDTPEYFVCIDQKNQRYLTIFVDDIEYLIIPISLRDIWLLVSNKLTICNCIRKQSDGFILTYHKEGSDMKHIAISNLDPDFFPEEEVYMDASQSVQDYYEALLSGKTTEI